MKERADAHDNFGCCRGRDTYYNCGQGRGRGRGQGYYGRGRGRN